MAHDPVFIDTAALIAMTFANDDLHQPALRAIAALARARTPIITTELVLVEYLNGSSRPALRVIAAGFVQDILRTARIEVVPVGRAMFIAALDPYANRHDKEWSFVDCASRLISRTRGVTRVFTSDHHFLEAGFETLL